MRGRCCMPLLCCRIRTLSPSWIGRRLCMGNTTPRGGGEGRRAVELRGGRAEVDGCGSGSEVVRKPRGIHGSVVRDLECKCYNGHASCDGYGENLEGESAGGSNDSISFPSLLLCLKLLDTVSIANVASTSILPRSAFWSRSRLTSRHVHAELVRTVA